MSTVERQITHDYAYRHIHRRLPRACSIRRQRSILFGSFARGEQTPNSDIDLCLVCGNAMTFGTLYELSHELERELGRKVEIVTNPPEHMRPAFRKSIKQEEIRLYVST